MGLCVWVCVELPHGMIHLEENHKKSVCVRVHVCGGGWACLCTCIHDDLASGHLALPPKVLGLALERVLPCAPWCEHVSQN